MCDHVCVCVTKRSYSIVAKLLRIETSHYFDSYKKVCGYSSLWKANIFRFCWTEILRCSTGWGPRCLMVRYTLSREVFGSTWSTYIISSGAFLKPSTNAPPGPVQLLFWLQPYPCDKVLPTILTRPWVLHCCIMTGRSCNKSSIEHSGHMFLEGRTSSTVTTLWKV